MHICVFCGSSFGKAEHVSAAQQVGRSLAERGIGIVYGGANTGMMGEVADAALAAGGTVVGVIPQALIDHEGAHKGLTELHVVDGLHERKALMAELSDAFVALPGGSGTLEELFEAWTWAQIGLHSKPVGLLNVDGYFDHLVRFVDHMVDEKLLRVPYKDMLIVESNFDRLLERYLDYRPANYNWAPDARPSLA